MTRRTGSAKLIMLTTIAMTGSKLSPAADWSETLEAATNVAYVKNPSLQPGSSQSDELAQLVLDGSTVAQTELSQLTLTPRFSTNRYEQETYLDINSGSIDLAYQRKLERGQWTFDAQTLTDSTVTSELGTTGITNINRRHYADIVSASYQYLVTERLSWQLQGAWQDTRYTDAEAFGLTNYTYGSVQTGPTWALSDRLQGSLFLETDRIVPQGATTQNDYSATVQLKRSFTEQYAWRASAGATHVDAGSGNTATSSVFELGATRQGERIQWDLSVKRAVLPIGLGLLALENAAALTMVVTTSERSTLNLSVSEIHTDPVTESLYLAPGISLSYQVYSGASWGQATAEWKYNFSPHWTLSAAYQQARARNYDVPQWANGNQARLGILWQSGRL